MRRKDDVLWKGILEDVFDDFLRFLNPDAESLLDFGKGFEFLDKELQQVLPPENEEFSPKVVDKLVKVFTKTGEEKWVLVHVEIQGQYHHDFASRMFRYYYRLIDKYGKPITAYAIFTEANLKARPDCFELDFMGTSLKYTFNTYKIASQSDEELLASENPFALVVLTAKTALSGSGIKSSLERDELLLNLKLELAKQLLIRQIPKEKVRVMMNFLKYYTRFENPEINSKFELAVEVLTERSNTMGIEELLLDRATKQGEQKGSHDKAVAIAKEMKKDGVAIEQIAKFTKLSVEEIEKL
ncbi:Rpn family recombination-promoting nuclease/putative transposase [Mucilaginibacter sp. McL0603]|uniref:Rpn family recombination-promoting nuclease/putative transposase n=1 Tax=Mucilaginibacter sp. McL0603 TaxID=3415670 RepID=UPI003CF84069